MGFIADITPQKKRKANSREAEGRTALRAHSTAQHGRREVSAALRHSAPEPPRLLLRTARHGTAQQAPAPLRPVRHPPAAPPFMPPPRSLPPPPPRGAPAAPPRPSPCARRRQALATSGHPPGSAAEQPPRASGSRGKLGGGESFRFRPVPLPVRAAAAGCWRRRCGAWCGPRGEVRAGGRRPVATRGAATLTRVHSVLSWCGPGGGGADPAGGGLGHGDAP